MTNAAVLTISDSVSAGTRADRSGPAVRERLEQLGWSVSVMEAIPDEASEIRLGEALAALSAEQREVILLKDFEGLTFRAIGSACGVSTHTAASRHRYAMDRLRSFFGEKK